MKKKNFENVEILIEDLDESDINSLIKKTTEIQKIKKSLVELEDMLKSKIKIFLKERRWDRYDGEEGLSVSLSIQSRQKVDMHQLKLMLSESQMAQVTTTSTFEKLLIITPEIRARLKNYVRKKKKV